MPKQTAQINQTDELIKTIENLTFTIEMAKAVFQRCTLYRIIYLCQTNYNDKNIINIQEQIPINRVKTKNSVAKRKFAVIIRLL